jgi:Tfp pilus assembly protein PilN
VSRLNLNLASRPFHNNVVYWLAFGACAVLLAAFTAYNSHQYGSLGAEIEKWDGVRRQQQAEFAQLSNDVVVMTQTVSKLDLKGLNARSAFANTIILSRLFSWSDLFSRLEKVQPENVRLRSIRPVITKEGTEVSVDAMAKDYDNVLKFEASLLDSDYFSFVYPLQESTREAQGGGEIRFNLAFGYVPEGRKKAGARAAAGGGPAADANSPAPAADANAPSADASSSGPAADANDVEDANSPAEEIDEGVPPAADPNARHAKTGPRR